ncbi:uncharacterized protein Z519_09524 [Cladophialophora bantiana CBS 173.52]|uniref:Uncharacterized protein n=1 Tax=Cladophialophora bantiana (strain ATCC 10958 / CBS 173.52 / CDC B-1940 / NIH 8579) TaxID=1442370 RepID=A0A0D2HA41_CLAB1|nr:uncharacterized protein Z519_09524 [Cladophialophora bantiana CBS 173.52]KIW90093.1 hypothetical protein Z519_09524 [Cladophialophora bantiana CBS 173.52]
MVVQQLDTFPEVVIPLQRLSLSNSTKQSPSGSNNTGYVTWPAPDGWYTPPQGPMNEKEEPFPAFQDPSKSLIIERTLLLDTLHTRRHERSRFEALLSRVAHSGHIKHDQDLSRTRASLSEILALGGGCRAQRGLGNKGKLPGPKGLNTDYFSNSNEPQPRDVLRWKMKNRCAKGVQQALIYEKELGMGFLDGAADEGESERGRTMKHTYPGAFNRAKVVTALTMLRETYPRVYKAGLVEQSKTCQASEKTSKQKATAAKGSQRATSPGRQMSLDGNDTEEFLGLSKFTDSFASVKNKASSIFRGLARKFSCEKTDLSDHTFELDSFPIVLKVNGEIERVFESSRSAIPGPASSETGWTRAVKEFTIDAGVVFPKDSGICGEPAHITAPVSAQTPSAQGREAARATTVRMCRTSTSRLMISVKVRSNKHKHMQSQRFARSNKDRVKAPEKITALN